MTHQFMYPEVTPVHGTTPGTDSGGPASAVGSHNDTASGPTVPSTQGAWERPARRAGRAAPLRTCGPRRRTLDVLQVSQVPSMSEEWFANEHRERLERFRRRAERVRGTEVGRIAIDVLGVHPDDVARALRGDVVQADEDDDGTTGPIRPRV